MSEEKSRIEEFREGLRNTYRLVILNDETFQEIGSYQLTRLNIYMLISSVIVMVAIVVTSIIVFTPIKHYIPGYGDVNLRRKAVELSESVDSLNHVMIARDMYYDNIKRILTGDLQTKDDFEQDTTLTISTDSLDVVRSKEDSLLRQKVETEDEFAVNIGRKPREFQDAGSSTVRVIDVFERHFFSPVKGGTISDEFHPERGHYGLDIVAPRNTPIQAVAAGVVIVSNWTPDTGHTIAIQHEGSLVSFYKHNSVLLKKIGNFVQAGEAIAVIGNTGELTDGPHLHLELWQDGRPLNPANYLHF